MHACVTKGPIPRHDGGVETLGGFGVLIVVTVGGV